MIVLLVPRRVSSPPRDTFLSILGRSSAAAAHSVTQTSHTPDTIWTMRLTPVAKLFSAVVIIAVVGYTGLHYYRVEEARRAGANPSTTTTPATAPASGSAATTAAPSAPDPSHLLRLTG